MIIGINGRIGSGKDTVGLIIQYLVCLHKDTLAPHQKFEDLHTQIKEFGLAPVSNKLQSGWEIKKFAFKLKQMICLFTGCTLSDLEDPNFKNKELPREWQYVMNGLGRPVHIDFYKGDTVFEEDPDRFMKKYTYRDFLQKLGTEAIRNVIHEDAWVNALFADYNKLDTFKGGCSRTYDDAKYTEPDWIITDVRFPNEFKAVKDRRGINIRVTTNRAGILSKHISETALDHHKFDYVIDNSGSIPDLIDKVREILIKEKIIGNE